MELKNEINKSKDVTTITKCLYDFLIKMEIDKKIENKIERLAENNMTEIAMEYETSWKVLVSVLDEIVLIFGGDKVTFEQYKQIM